MPLYKYRCENCGKEFTELKSIPHRYDVKCPECGNDKCNMLFTNHNRGFDFEPQFFEHLDKKPVWIRNKQHLKEECKRRGVMAKCLAD
jgi:putative FmdB family regulatory protein